MMWKAIAIIALTLGLEAGFLLNAAVPPKAARTEAPAVLAGQPPANGFAQLPARTPRSRS